MNRVETAQTPQDLFACAVPLDASSVDERAIDRWAREASGRELLVVAAAARISFRKAGPWGDLATARERLRALACSSSVAALLSLHRNGYLRELAVDELGGVPSSRRAIAAHMPVV